MKNIYIKSLALASIMLLVSGCNLQCKGKHCKDNIASRSTIINGSNVDLVSDYSKNFVELNERSFFGFDNDGLTAETKSLLNKQIKFIKDNVNNDVTFVVEGHCDERGTKEYNLGLGARRAEAVKRYLIANGIDASKLTIVSYGSEKPFDLGHNESAWKKNRTAIIVATR